MLLGLADPEEAVGKTDFDLYPGQDEDAQRFYEEEQEIMNTGKASVRREWQVPSTATGERASLARCLSDEKPEVRTAAAGALADMGPGDAVPIRGSAW